MRANLGSGRPNGTKSKTIRALLHAIDWSRPEDVALIARFEAAVRSRERSPKKSWAAIECDLGYYDQMHMVLHLAMHGISDKPADIVEPERRQHNMLNLCSSFANRLERPQKRVR
jgi:hypothetical protein